MKKFYYCFKDDVEQDDKGNYNLYIGEGDVAMNWKYDDGDLNLLVGEQICIDVVKDVVDEEDEERIVSELDAEGSYTEDKWDEIIKRDADYFYDKYKGSIHDVVELDILYDHFNDTFIAVDDIVNDAQEIARKLDTHGVENIAVVLMEEPTFYE